jgi:hypothetical protein
MALGVVADKNNDSETSLHQKAHTDVPAHLVVENVGIRGACDGLAL